MMKKNGNQIFALLPLLSSLPPLPCLTPPLFPFPPHPPFLKRCGFRIRCIIVLKNQLHPEEEFTDYIHWNLHHSLLIINIGQCMASNKISQGNRRGKYCYRTTIYRPFSIYERKSEPTYHNDSVCDAKSLLGIIGSLKVRSSDCRRTGLAGVG